MAQKEECTVSKLIENFTKYTVEHQKYPRKRDLLEACGAKNEEFKAMFDNMTNIKKQVWMSAFEETILTLAESEEYDTYMARDKMLAFYFTWIEELNQYRDYLKFVFKHKKQHKIVPKEMSVFLKAFETFTDSILEAGKQNGEVASRMLIGKQLKKILRLKLIFILRFWLNDKSDEYTRTDAAIEKSVHLAFDILGRNAFDTAFDLGKFVIQGRKK